MNSQSFTRILRPQYGAVLRMLARALDACPKGLWDHRDGLEAPFWAQALHAISSTHFYLLDELDGSAMRALSAALSRELGVDAGQEQMPVDVPRLRKVIEKLTEPDAYPSITLDKDALRHYLLAAQEAARVILADSDRFDRPNIMPWSGATLADRLVYNLRHAQHHIGRLHSILGRNHIGVPWVMGDDEGLA